MIKTVQGVYTSVVIFDTHSEDIEDYAIVQIKALCDNEAFSGCKIRIMPDVHQRKAGPVGFTSTLKISLDKTTYNHYDNNKQLVLS